MRSYVVVFFFVLLGCSGPPGPETLEAPDKLGAQAQGLEYVDVECDGKPRGASCASAHSDEINQCDGQGHCVDCVNHIGCNESSICDASLQACVSFIPPQIPACAGVPHGTPCVRPGRGGDADYCDGVGGCVDCISDAGCPAGKVCDLFGQLCVGTGATPPPPSAPPPAAPQPEGYMFAPSSDVAMQWGDVTGDGVPENFMSVTIGAAVANAVCQQFVIPVFLPSELCEPVGGSGRFCQRSIAVPSFFLVRTICFTPNAPPMDARMRSDTSNVIFNVVRSGNYQIEDASTVSGTRGATVTFGIPLSPRFATAGEMGNRCPAGSVLLSSAALAPLGANRLCVQTSNPPELAQVSAQVSEALSRIASNPTAESVDANVPEAQSILDRVISVLEGLFACQIDPDGVTLLCVDRRGFAAPAAAILAACPVKPREDLFAACVGRGEQATTGCAAIACIEALNDLGFAGCLAATALVVPSRDLLSKTAVGATVCGLIHRRDHFYTAPRDGTPRDICTQFESPECSLDLVLDEALADARAAAPTVLQGRPVNGIARPPLTGPLPIDTSNPSKLYYLGNFIDLARIGFGSANTSNPITLAASRSFQFISDGRTTRACFTTTNRTHPDHLLEGQVVNCLFDDGFGVKSLVIGTGSNTRNALANELAGPFLLGRVQDMLRGRVLARLDATRPPPPCRTCFPEPE